MKLPRDSRVLRHRLNQAIWDANHNRERELDAIFDTIEAYMAEEAAHQAGVAPSACCECAERIQREDTTLLGYDCLEHGWQPRAAARRDAWKELNAMVTQAGGTIRYTPPVACNCGKPAPYCRCSATDSATP